MSRYLIIDMDRIESDPLLKEDIKAEIVTLQEHKFVLSEEESLEKFRQIYMKGHADGWFDGIEDEENRDERWEKFKETL